MKTLTFDNEYEAKGFAYILNNVAGRLLSSFSLKTEGSQVHTDEVPDSIFQYIERLPDYPHLEDIGKFKRAVEFLTEEVELRFDSAENKEAEKLAIKSELDIIIK